MKNYILKPKKEKQKKKNREKHQEGPFWGLGDEVDDYT